MTIEDVQTVLRLQREKIARVIQKMKEKEKEKEKKSE